MTTSSVGMPWWSSVIIMTGIMLMNGSFIIQCWDAEVLFVMNFKKQIAGLEFVGNDSVGKDSLTTHVRAAITAFALTLNIYSTVFIVLEIVGLCLFLFPTLILFWKTNVLEKKTSGYWVLCFMGILFWHVSYFALRSMNSNSRRSLIVPGTGGQQHVNFDLHEIENAWTVYLVTSIISIILILVSIVMLRNMFVGHDNLGWRLWALKILSCACVILCGTSIIFGVYAENFLISCWLMACGIGLGTGIYTGYSFVRLRNNRHRRDRRHQNGEKIESEDEEIIPLRLDDN
jgi:hypothetical protein